MKRLFTWMLMLCYAVVLTGCSGDDTTTPATNGDGATAGDDHAGAPGDHDDAAGDDAAGDDAAGDDAAGDDAAGDDAAGDDAAGDDADESGSGT